MVFDTLRLQQAFIKGGSQAVLSEVQYLNVDDIDQSFANKFIVMNHGINLHIDPGEKRNFIKNCLARLAVNIKHKGFKEENEWRFSLFHSDNISSSVEYRVGNGFLMPYINFDWSPIPEALKSVVIGPDPDPLLTAQSISMLLWTYGRKDVEIVPSKVPYRT